MIKKIVFITTHNWDTKRQGGFHKFAEATCLSGIETVFFSFPRPYYALFMKREQLNKDVIKTLSKGKYYDCIQGDEGKTNRLLNITYPTFRIPDSFGRFFSDKIMNWLLSHSFKSFKRFCEKYFEGTDCFVFESCEGVFFIDKLKEFFPDAKMIYRPSDPMVYASVPQRVKNLEKNILYKADLSLIVNQEGIDSYKKNIEDFESKVRYEILSNGIDIASYTKKYPVPQMLQKPNTVLYVGAWEVEWELLFLAAETNPDFNYIVVCPNYPSPAIQKKVCQFKNLFYVPGIKPQEVPAWITNCKVVMVPYRTDFYKDRPLGITAKYYQAMAAQKPIVAYCDTPKLKDVGISVNYSYEDFIKQVQLAMNKNSCTYQFDLQGRDWSEICKKFIKACEKNHED
ncbi:GumK N-terminal domain-containing glycosyltransferase [Treponema pectinovorum]|uniref:GumK N-terminal domain-containing glycosyltransferase n=1 Tax=Treponema pectinovorum TaxID=164 RepID=UPI0011F17B59|nr:glycosyltransferase family 4 protein [Treponema pectinovorum]